MGVKPQHRVHRIGFEFAIFSAFPRSIRRPGLNETAAREVANRQIPKMGLPKGLGVPRGLASRGTPSDKNPMVRTGSVEAIRLFRECYTKLPGVIGKNPDPAVKYLS